MLLCRHPCRHSCGCLVRPLGCPFGCSLWTPLTQLPTLPSSCHVDTCCRQRRRVGERRRGGPGRLDSWRAPGARAFGARQGPSRGARRHWHGGTLCRQLCQEHLCRQMEATYHQYGCPYGFNGIICHGMACHMDVHIDKPIFISYAFTWN
jgi:hypothetical protein